MENEKMLSSIRWFDGITEVVPRGLGEMWYIINTADAYIIADPENAAVFLRYLQEEYGDFCAAQFKTDGVRLGRVFTRGSDGASWVPVDDLLRHFTGQFNSICTLTEDLIRRELPRASLSFS